MKRFVSFQSPIGTNKTRFFREEIQLYAFMFQSPIGTNKTISTMDMENGKIESFNPL